MALAASHNGEADPIAAPISSIPVHQIKATSRRIPKTRDMTIRTMVFLLESKSLHLES